MQTTKFIASLNPATIGILTLETQFPRILGDIANAQTWPFPVRYKVVRGASPKRVVKQQAQGLLNAFIEAGQELIEEGVNGITTSCGFLVLYQQQLAASLTVPVATSALMQVPLLETCLPAGKRVGIITIAASSLLKDHLRSAGCATDVPIESTEPGLELSRAILNDEPELNSRLACAHLVDAGIRLIQKHPQTGAIVLECANMAPYAAMIHQATRVPVYSIVNFITWFQSGLKPKTFAG